MYLATTVISLLLLSVVQAAPAKHSTTSGSKPQLKPLLPKPNPLVEKLVVLDPTCTADQTKRIEVEKALSDLYDVVEVAQHITEKDPAFNNYFITYPLGKSPVLFNKFSAPHRDHINLLVPNMARSILTGGGKNQKFTVKCPAVGDEPSCEIAWAFVVPAGTTMNLCPHFFSEKVVRSLSSKTFTPDGWCTPPKHLLSNFITGVNTIAHEITHFKFIASHALELSLVKPATHPIQWFTQDIIGRPDENDPRNLATYGGFHHYSAARVLKQRWSAYLAYLDQLMETILDPHKDLHLREPPVETADNAESYSLAFIEYYFFKKCQHLGFNPNEVVLSL